MKAISTSQLLATIKERKGAEIATILTQTDARLLKTGNPFGQVFKRSKLNVQFGFDYENACNNRQEKEGMERDFKAQAHTWADKVEPKTVVKDGKEYFRIRVLDCYAVSYHTADGTELTKEQVKPFLPKRSKPKTQKTEEEVFYRNFKPESIKGIAMRGENYTII